MGKANSFFKKSICFFLLLTFITSALSFSAFAALGEKYYGPNVIGISMDNTRSRFTISFDAEIKSATSDLKNCISLSQSGKALSPLPEDAKVSISGFSIQIIMPSSLDTTDNFFRIDAGALVNQTINLETSLFDARGPALATLNPVSVNRTGTSVTIRFRAAVKGYPNDESLFAGNILLARNGTLFSEVIPEENLNFNNTRDEITITFPEPLTGSNSKIKITAGKLKNLNNGNLNITDIITPAIKVQSSTTSSSSSSTVVTYPEIDSTLISSDRRTVTIYFTSNIKNSFASGGSSSLAGSLIKSNIYVSRASNKNYELLSSADSVVVSSNYVKITFDTPLNDNKNYIKIAKNTLTDENDNYINQEYVTDNVTQDLPDYSSVPEYASISVPSVYSAILYFNIPVIKNSKLSDSEMLSLISVSRDGGSFKSLTSKDVVTFSANSMTIKFDTPVTGSNNRIKIQANALTSKIGTPLGGVITTEAFKYDASANTYVDSTPKYVKASYDKASRKITLEFEKNIKLVSGKVLLENILISKNSTSFLPLSSEDIATISPQNAISIVLAEPLSGTKNAVKLLGSTIADYDTGYVLNEIVTTDYLSVDATSSDSVADITPDVPTNDLTDTMFVNVSVSDDFYTLVLKLNESVYNNYSSLAELKSNIKLLRNGSFVSLTSDDYVRIDNTNNEIVIVLTQPVYDYFSQLKILPNSLRRASGNSISQTILTAPLGEADGIGRLYVNDTALIGGVSTQISGDSVIATLNNESLVTSTPSNATVLIKIPYSKSKAILNISSTVASSIKNKGDQIALSYGNVTHYIPSSSIPTLTEGDVLSLAIDSVSTAASMLSTAATNNSFTVAVPAAKLSANVISAEGLSTALSHTAFAEKRFLVRGANENSIYTPVRVENSGTVVPVPAENASKNTFVYLTAKTLSDGNYAVVCANHTFINTPNWVQTPANTLGSHLILTNAAGSDLKSSQPISRSETVVIMTRTLGILSDSNGTSPFFDMMSTDSFFNAVMSSVSNKLISGYPDGTFKPKNTLTRAEAMTIVARALRFIQGKSVSASSDMTLEEADSVLSKFSDYKNVDNWAKSDIAECVKAGVVNGDNKGRLNPKSNVTRAELIQLMYNILNKSNMM